MVLNNHTISDFLNPTYVDMTEVAFLLVKTSSLSTIVDWDALCSVFTILLISIFLVVLFLRSSLQTSIEVHYCHQLFLILGSPAAQITLPCKAFEIMRIQP